MCLEAGPLAACVHACLSSPPHLPPRILPTPAAEEEAEEAAGGGGAAPPAGEQQAAAEDGQQRQGKLDLDSIVDLSSLDLSALERPARMPPLARVRSLACVGCGGKRCRSFGGTEDACSSRPGPGSPACWSPERLLRCWCADPPRLVGPPVTPSVVLCSPSLPQTLLGPTWRPDPLPPGARILSMDEYRASRGW